MSLVADGGHTVVRKPIEKACNSLRRPHVWTVLNDLLAEMIDTSYFTYDFAIHYILCIE